MYFTELQIISHGKDGRSHGKSWNFLYISLKSSDLDVDIIAKFDIAKIMFRCIMHHHQV